MGGHYQNKKKEYKKIIESWLATMISGRLWEKYNDIHIDEIEPKLKNDKKMWVDIGILLLSQLESLIDHDMYDTFLAIPLSYSEKQTRLETLTLEIIKQEIDLTPPSLYFFPKDEENYRVTIKQSKLIKGLSRELKLKVYYSEILEHFEYFRVIYIKK
jgi:hypothetical protein